MVTINIDKLPSRYKPDGDSSSGGFSEVLFCKDIQLEREVAIKTIQNPLEKDRLRDEIAALLLMRSKHVVQVYDLVELNNEDAGIVLEFINGDDLIDSNFPQQSLDNYLKTLWQIASGIADIHEAHIIHRDIKPNNMKLDDEGILKIFDFGLSRDSNNDAKTMGFKGTQGFAAPELFSHDEVEFTKAVDVYAFGVLSIYLLDKTLPRELLKLPPVALADRTFDHFLTGDYSELIPLFERCLINDPSIRPKMVNIKNEIKRFLLKDQHQALAVLNTNSYYLNKDNKSATFSAENIGSFSIIYDGLKFHVDAIEGEVVMNNSLLSCKTELIGSCVIALGNQGRGMQRSFITFDISNPEVVL